MAREAGLTVRDTGRNLGYAAEMNRHPTEPDSARRIWAVWLIALSAFGLFLSGGWLGFWTIDGSAEDSGHGSTTTSREDTPEIQDASPSSKQDLVRSNLDLRAIFTIYYDVGRVARNAVVTCYSVTEGKVLMEGASDSEGRFYLPENYPSSVLLLVNWANTGSRYASMQRYQLPPGGCCRDVFIQPQDCAVTLLVLADDVPAPEVPVRASDRKATHTGITNASGIYTFENLEPGTAIVAVGVSRSVLAMETLNTSSGGHMLHILRLAPGRLTVSLECEVAGQFSIKDIIVTIQRLPSLPEIRDRHQSTDSSGTASFEHLAPGHYMVSVGFRYPMPAEASGLQAGPSFEVVEVKESSVELTLGLRLASVVELRVFNPSTGYSVPATITLSIPGIGVVSDWRYPRVYSTSDDFQTFIVPSGGLQLFAINNVHGWGSHDVHCLPGERIRCSIPLTMNGPSLTVRVRLKQVNRLLAIQIYNESGRHVYSLSRSVDTSSMQEQAMRRHESSAEGRGSSIGVQDSEFYIPSLPTGQYLLVITDGIDTLATHQVYLFKDEIVLLNCDQ